MTMKSKLALTFFTILFVMCATSLFAQNNPFAGRWQLAGIAPGAGYSFHKTFDEKGNFFVTRTVGTITVKTHYGKYVIKDSAIYLEIMSTETDPTRAHVAGQTTTIEYKFSEDQKTLTVKGLAVNGNSDWHEQWKKIDVPSV
jgi:hypothetical protein